MIDIVQWRASIGAFNISYQSNKPVTSQDFSIGFSELCYHHTVVIWFVSIYCLINVLCYVFCLLLSGDIETNPRPVHKLCPQCDRHIHIRKKVCLCGYVFCKNYRTFTKVTSPSVSTVNLDACSPDLTQTTGASLSITQMMSLTHL